MTGTLGGDKFLIINNIQQRCIECNSNVFHISENQEDTLIHETRYECNGCGVKYIGECLCPDQGDGDEYLCTADKE